MFMKSRCTFRMSNLQNQKRYIRTTFTHLTQINNGQGQLSRTGKDTGQGVSARQPEALTKMTKELDTLQRICKPGLIFSSSGVFSFVVSVKAESVRIIIKKEPPASSQTAGKPQACGFLEERASPLCSGDRPDTRAFLQGAEPSGSRRAHAGSRGRPTSTGFTVSKSRQLS